MYLSRFDRLGMNWCFENMPAPMLLKHGCLQSANRGMIVFGMYPDQMSDAQTKIEP